MANAEKHKAVKTEFPHSVVLKASAGSGKTHELTRRYVEFLLSDSIQKNGLRNILAITFSNNAAAEMRERILEWLKALSIGRNKEIRELADATGLSEEELTERATTMLATVLEHYSDLQIRTIDSFMTGIFKASAIDLGFAPDFEVVLQNDALMEYAFDMFLRNVRDKSEASRFLGEMIERIMEAKLQTSGYPWDPSSPVLEEVKNIYRKAASTWKQIRARDLSVEISEAKKRISKSIEGLEAMIEGSGLERNNRSAFRSVLGLIRNDRFPEILDKGLKSPPLKSYKGRDETKKRCHEQISGEWKILIREISGYIRLYAEAYYYPYLKVYEAVRGTIDLVKKKEERVFIEDINRTLAECISREIVPDVYFRIGETVYHYLIDEFQDTSPVQWKNLFPLIENSLSQQGSLFVVGDTKQAIYGFRDADYRIMKEMEKQQEAPFPSARHEVKELDINYRSLQQVIDFNAEVFKKKVAADEEYGATAALSGLTEYDQKVKPGNEQKGVVQVLSFERDGDEIPERAGVQELLNRLRARGYGLRDIAILTFENDDVVSITAWLNELGVPFISYSSLDIRRRKIIAEMVSLLRFLDSPLDDLSFAAVVLGDMLDRLLIDEGIRDLRMRDFVFRNRRSRPLYKSFQTEFPDIWGRFFDGLFRSVGYLPLYDLVTEVFRLFKVFTSFREEEAALAKMLEVVKNCEQNGKNSLRDFIGFVSDEDKGETEWNIDVPKDMDAVKVMTVHKAKGLGFPVVILLVYGKVSKGFSYVLKEIPETDELCFTRLNRKIAEMVEDLGGLYSGLSERETVNSLNSLYVALTRAEAELYVFCVTNRSGKEGFHPCRFLPSDEYSAGEMPREIYPGEGRRSSRIELEHRAIRALRSVTAERVMNLKEKEWGEYIHRVLAGINTWHKGENASIRKIIRQVNRESVTVYPEDEVYKLISAFFDSAGIGDLFTKKEGRIVQREMQIVDGSGNLFRIDRLVIGPEHLMVIDFKTGRDRDAEGLHIHQMKQYMKILAHIYPGRTIEGVVAYVELFLRKIVA